MRLTQPIVDWCRTGHHHDRHAPTIMTPRLPGCSSPTTSNSADGPLRTLSTSLRSTLTTTRPGWAARFGGGSAGDALLSGGFDACETGACSRAVSAVATSAGGCASAVGFEASLA